MPALRRGSADRKRRPLVRIPDPFRTWRCRDRLHRPRQQSLWSVHRWSFSRPSRHLLRQRKRRRRSWCPRHAGVCNRRFVNGGKQHPDRLYRRIACLAGSLGSGLVRAPEDAISAKGLDLLPRAVNSIPSLTAALPFSWQLSWPFSCLRSYVEPLTDSFLVTFSKIWFS
jgi:hypothetical protein